MKLVSTSDLQSALNTLLLLLVLFIGCQPENRSFVPDPISDDLRNVYRKNLVDCEHALTELEQSLTTSPVDSEILRNRFRNVRASYKRGELFTEYYAPSTASQINGAALLTVEEDDPSRVPIPPEGFQVIETMLYPSYNPRNSDSLLLHTRNCRLLIHRLQRITETFAFTPAQVFDAMRLEMIRVVALGITGFDSPVAELSLPEAVASLQGIREVLEVYHSSGQRKSVADDLMRLIDSSVRFLSISESFASFDRFEFISRYANPLAKSLWQYREEQGIPVPSGIQALENTAATIFDSNAFNPEFFAPPYARPTTASKTELGRALFFDPSLSGDGSRSCASCHNPDLAFTDGRTKSIAFGRTGTVMRNAPTIINSGLQRSFFYDERVAYAEDQATQVLMNPDEMHGSPEATAMKLSNDVQYRRLFERAFNKRGLQAITPLNMRIALAAFVRSLNRYQSRFDRAMRGEVMLEVQERRGFNLFSGKAKCATCHFIPTFGGTVPPMFTETETEVLGVPSTPEAKRLDADPGLFAITGSELHRGRFKTPSLRNAELTAPYMHNGVFTTLDQVLEFYNRGGGLGLKLKVPNQTLPDTKLRLSEQEKKDIIRFIATLTDTTGTRSH